MHVKKEFAIVRGIQGNKTSSRRKNSDLINVNLCIFMLNGTVYMVVYAKKRVKISH